MASHKNHLLQFDYVFAIDWSALQTIDKLRGINIILDAALVAFLMFRVFSTSTELYSSDEDYKIYVTTELDAIQKSDITFVLSHVDYEKIQQVQEDA